ncbi:hemolysin family protein [Isosphaeraceae bacterium EP7]
MSFGLGMLLGISGLIVLWTSVALTRALRTYSVSRLEEICTRRGRPARASAIDHNDVRTERSVGALSTIAALGLAALLGALVNLRSGVPLGRFLPVVALGVAALGHLVAEVVGRLYAEDVLDRLWPLTGPLRVLMSPITALSLGVEKLATHLSGASASPARPPSVEVEIHTPMETGEDGEADLTDSTRALLERVVELSQRDVSEIMTPRSRIIALPADVSASVAARLFVESGRTRIPLFGENRDDIVGVLHAKDLLTRMIDGGIDATNPRILARPAFCVPETKEADILLDEMRARRTHMAIILDEYGGVSGLVTMEDLIEQLVGPIDDEHDTPPVGDQIEDVGEGSYLVDATLDLERLNNKLGIRLPTGGDYQTLAGYAFYAFGRVPEVGSTFRAGDAELTVVEVIDHAIRRVRIDLSGPRTNGHAG